MLNTPIGRLRAAGLAEGVSFLVLLGIAMPLKYMAGMPGAVKVVGWLHGLLFILYMAALAQANVAARWPLPRLLGLLLAGLVPLGPLFAEPFLRREQRGRRAAG